MALWPASAIVGVFEWVLLKIYFANNPTRLAISPPATSLGVFHICLHISYIGGVAILASGLFIRSPKNPGKRNDSLL